MLRKIAIALAATIALVVSASRPMSRAALLAQGFIGELTSL
jgi:hypothetical protein